MKAPLLLKVILFAPAVFIASVLAFNWSGFRGLEADAQPRLIAHRGVHQVFDLDGVENDTCTAQRISPPTHDFIENTIPSMKAAFEAGASVVELDVHLTPDGQFAVMHDWGLECRTEGKGVTQDTPMSVLKTLDVGYGYTGDGGATFPLRGKGVGLMPTLPEVFEALPNRAFLINFKSRRVDEGEALAALLKAHPEWRTQAWGSYGGEGPTEASWAAVEGLRGYTKDSLMSCLGAYAAIGWTGFVPEECHNTMVVVPANLGPFLWGWPHLFTRRMERAGSEVILLGPMQGGDIGSRGIDDVSELRLVPKGFGGWVWTNRIEVIGPALAARSK